MTTAIPTPHLPPPLHRLVVAETRLPAFRLPVFLFWFGNCWWEDAHHGDDIIIWPDDMTGPTWCFRHDLDQYTHMSDDYLVLRRGTPEHRRLAELS